MLFGYDNDNDKNVIKLLLTAKLLYFLENLRTQSVLKIGLKYGQKPKIVTCFTDAYAKPAL